MVDARLVDDGNEQYMIRRMRAAMVGRIVRERMAQEKSLAMLSTPERPVRPLSRQRRVRAYSDSAEIVLSKNCFQEHSTDYDKSTIGLAGPSGSRAIASGRWLLMSTEN
jgi:hypothetical protein